MSDVVIVPHNNGPERGGPRGGMKLTVYRGSQGGAGGGKTALCLCGGGITGALFEVGVLAAFDDQVGKGASNAFDVYVGSSAGASVGIAVGQGVPAGKLFGALRDPCDAFLPLRRQDVYQAEVGPWVRATGRLLKGAITTALAHLRRQENRLGDDLATLGDQLPAGLFRLERYVDFLRRFYRRVDLAERFTELQREIYVVANDVDSTDRVVFGKGPLRDVEIARAVAASSAIPIFFEPVRIGDRDYFDGGIGRVAHLDVAIESGADRILVVNPVVPIHNTTGGACLPSTHGDCARLREKGLLCVGNQAWRIANKARLHFGIKRYLADHPRVEVLLIEPGDDATLLFLSGSMGLKARREILDYAREEARKALARTSETGLKIASVGARTETPPAYARPQGLPGASSGGI